MRYKVDSMSLRNGVLMLEGWCIPSKTEKIEYSVVDRNGSELKCTAVARDRVDVAQQFGADRMSGFTVAVPFERSQDAWLVMKDGNDIRKVRVNNSIIEKKNSVKARRIEKLLALVHFETLTVSWDFIRENGFSAFWKKAIHKLRKIDEDYDYAEWQLKTALPEAQIEAQRTGWKQLKMEHFPLISIVVPAYNTPEKYLRMLLDSFEAQTYPIFEAVIADGSEPGHTSVADTVSEYAEKDPERFKLVSLGGNRGISENTNAGLRAAKGDYIALCDHDDELPPWALYEVVKAIADNPKAMFIYTDEDKIDFDGKALFEPHFKSDLNMEMLCSVNYICHLSVIRRDLLQRVGGFRSEYDGAQDHDFFFRCLEAASDGHTTLDGHAASDGQAAPANDRSLSPESVQKLKEGRFVSETVVHIPVICYHWRYHKGSTASDPEAKLYAFEAGCRAVEDHYRRMNIPFKKVERGVTYGYYHTVFEKPGATPPPLVSIIIPNKDHRADLDKCIRSCIDRSEYRNLEFIIVENNSEEPETFEYYKQLELVSEQHQSVPIRVVRWEREFNYSAINNFGVKHASGDLLLFLNNDVEMTAPESITEMVNYCLRDNVGIVGARLKYGDDTIQHAGVIVGLGGIAGAAFVGLHEKENSYMHRMMCVQDLSAVTAACMMMRREVFEAAGGFREELAVAFNDIDMCMKVRALGKLVVYDPYSVFYHYESKSRGLEDTPEKVQRFNGEIAVFAHYWGAILEHGDPYYNPNLTLRKSNFALRDLTREKPGEPYRLELDVEKQLQTVLREKQRRGLQ
ncbi:MAG: glycosyltransferase family 2 protein [Eubacteriales bacterium]|nr:glycosyltransferase family 2 protein [Eubacteriales bacterium]